MTEQQNQQQQQKNEIKLPTAQHSTAQRTDFCVLSPYMHSAHINTMSHGSACRLVVPMWKFYGQLFYDQCTENSGGGSQHQQTAETIFASIFGLIFYDR